MKRLLARIECRCRATAATKTGRWEKMSGLSDAILPESARGSVVKAPRAPIMPHGNGTSKSELCNGATYGSAGGGRWSAIKWVGGRPTDGAPPTSIGQHELSDGLP